MFSIDEHVIDCVFLCVSLPGKTCGDRVYNCSDHACQNGGKCRAQGDNDYVCECKEAYSGKFCQFYSSKCICTV